MKNIVIVSDEDYSISEYNQLCKCLKSYEDEDGSNTHYIAGQLHECFIKYVNLDIWKPVHLYQIEDSSTLIKNNDWYYDIEKEVVNIAKGDISESNQFNQYRKISASTKYIGLPILDLETVGNFINEYNLDLIITEETIEKAAETYAEKENSAYTNDMYGFIAGANWILKKLKKMDIILTP